MIRTFPSTFREDVRFAINVSACVVGERGIVWPMVISEDGQGNYTRKVEVILQKKNEIC